MANENEFALPGNSYDVIQKIIHAYVLCGDKELTLDDVAPKAGMDRTQVSKNNGFLASVGIIEGGHKKTITPLGKKLGLAISHGDKEATAAAWRDLIQTSERLKGVVDMVGIQNGIATEVLPGKVAAHFGLPGGKPQTNTSAKCIIDILKDAELLIEEDERVTLPTTNKGATPSMGHVEP